MKTRAGSRGRPLLAAAAVASVALLPLYGDPRPSPVTHPEWARMVLRALDLLADAPLAQQASQVFATLSWKNSLAYRADRYLTAEGVTVRGEGEARAVVAEAPVGEVSYPLAISRGGDYRVRLLLSGDPRTPAEAEIRLRGQEKPEKVFTVAGGPQPAWADAGTLHLDPGAYSATVLLPKDTRLEYVELAPPCLNPIEPLGGWKPAALASTGDVAVTALKALDLEHELPPSDTALEIEAEDLRTEGLVATEASYGPLPGQGGVWLKAGEQGLDASVFLDLKESGLYAVSVFGVSGNGIRFAADACRKSVLCPEPERGTEAQWRQVFSGQFAAGRHFIAMNLGAGAAIQRIRIERKKEAMADYLATLRRLGLDLGADGPVTRDKAVEAMRFIKTRRGLEPMTLCQDILDRDRTLVAATGGAGQPLPPGGGPGPGPGPGVDPVDPLGPPVLPPQEIASPVLPNP